MNPKAARTDPEVVRSVCAVLEREGCEVEVAGTTRANDAGEIAARGVSDGAEVVAVYGGDGTTMQAVRALVGRPGVALGLVPGGTGNLLAGNLRVPRSPAKAAQVIARSARRRIDLGRLERADGVHYFAVACGAGFDAELMASTPGESKRRWKMGAYVARAVETLGAIQSVPHRVTIDGQVHEFDAASILIANCGEVIPSVLTLGSQIAPDDGLLDVVALNARGFVDALGVVWHLVSGGDAVDERVRYARGRRITVETASTRPVQADGEATGQTPFSVGVLPGALEVLVPEEHNSPRVPSP